MNPATRMITECPDCGPMRVLPAEVTLRHCLDDDAWTYRFVCPACRLRAVVPTSAERALVAVEAGLEVESWSLPPDVPLPDEGLPMTYADLLELHLALIEPDFVERLCGTGGDQGSNA